MGTTYILTISNNNGTSKDLGGKFEIKLGNAGIIHATGYLTVKSHVGIQCFIVNDCPVVR